jgi:hypothetical protein
MALDYYLELNTKLTPLELMTSILSLESFEVLEKSTEFESDGVVGGISTASDGFQEIVQENFGFTPTISAWFRSDSYENYQIGMRNGLKAFMTILQQDTGDAVIFVDAEWIKMTRINGKIVLDSESFHEDKDMIWRFGDVPFADFEVKSLPKIE